MKDEPVNNKSGPQGDLRSESREVREKWTPGPWITWSDEGDHQSICAIDGDPGVMAHRECVASVPYKRENWQANARLIAAAPELYEELDQAPILSQYHGMHGFEVERFIGDYEKWSDRKRAALAKARGDA